MSTGAVPPLPQGYSLDSVSPPLPAGYKLDSEGQAPVPRTWMDSAADFGKEFLKQVNPVSAVKGLYQTVTNPKQAYENDAAARDKLRQTAEQAFENGAKETDPIKKANHYLNGATYMLQGVLPVIGPALQAPAEQIEQGNYAKGAGQVAGMVANMNAPEAVNAVSKVIPGSGAAQQLAGRMYQSALKPSTTYSTGEVGSMVKTGLDNAIPVSAAGVDKLSGLVNDLNQNIRAKIQAGSATGATINKYDVASRLASTANKFRTQVNPEADLNAVSSAGNEFLRNQPDQIPVAQAQALKQGTYQQLGSKAYGELATATSESQKALARGIKEELQTQFPEIQGLNANEGKLIGLDEALQRAVKRIDNHQLLGIGTPIAGAAAGVVGGAGVGAASAALKMVIDDPIVKSKLAIALNRASKGKLPVNDAQVRVAGYLNALGNAVGAQGSGDQTNGQQK